MAAGPLLRFGGSKVKTGCVTCKNRRVKCDEGKPECMRCVKSKRQCGGYPPPAPRGASDLSFVVYTPRPSRSPSPLPGFKAQEIRAMDFFRFRTAVELGGPFNPEIWTSVILQASYSEPVVQHAVIALGALHESFGNHHDAHSASCDYAMQYYNRAITQVIGLDFTADHFDVILISTILFAAFESLRGHCKLAITHIASGANILAEKDPTTGNWRRGFLRREIFVPTFTRLGNQLTEIDEKSPGPNIKRLPARPLVPLPDAFASLGNAQVAFDCFLDSLWRLLALEDKSDSPEISFTKSYEITHNLMPYFSDWHTVFERSGFSDSDPATLILLANVKMLQIVQRFPPGSAETLWDNFTPEFKDLMESLGLVAALSSCYGPNNSGTDSSSDPIHVPTFTFNLGIIMPLYFICTRCRDPSTRGEALNMLSRCNRKEGIWDSAIAASLAKRIIVLEEAATTATPLMHASQIPLAARITESDIFFGTGREGRVRYRTGIEDQDHPVTEDQLERFIW